MFQTSLNLLEQALDVNGNKLRLSGQIPHIEDSLKILDKEKDAAELAKTGAKADLTLADQRVNALNAEIEANRVALEQYNFELEARRIQSVFQVIVAVVAVIGAAYTGGASLSAVPGLLVSAQSTWRELEYDEKTKTATYKGKHLVDWFRWREPRLKPEIEALIKGLEDVVKKSVDIIDKVKVLSDIDKSTVNGQLISQYKDLVKKSAELAFERAGANLRFRQAELQNEAATLRIDQAQADLERIRGQQATLSSDIKLLGEIAKILVNRAQEYVNIITKYVFWAARALESYTLADLSGEISYDYGYIHPDAEENAYLVLSRGDASRVLNLMRDYIFSWNRLPGVITYRDRYETYRMDLSTDLQFWQFQDEASLKLFRQTKNFDFVIALNELLPGRLEAKVDTVYVSLIGATASDPRITCILEHSGESSAKQRDGTTVQITAPPGRAPISATKNEGEFGGPGVSVPLAFWGRSPAARWRLYIEPEVLSRSNVDLSGLSKIQIAIAYQSI